MVINSPLFESGQWYLGGSGRCEAPNGCGSFNIANGIQYKDAIETYGFDIRMTTLLMKIWGFKILGP